MVLWSILMNDVTFCIVLYIIYIFIFIGGWLRTEIAKARWHEYIILLILLVMMLAPLFHFSAFGLQFSMLAVILPILSMFLMISLAEKERFQVLLGGILIATIYNLLIGIFSIDPVLLIIDERLLIGIILGLLLGLLHFPLQIKWIISTVGLWLGLVYFSFNYSSQVKNLQLFSYYELDLLFTLYICITLMHFVFNLIYRLGKRKPYPQHES